MTAPLLTETELEALDLTRKLWDTLLAVTGDALGGTSVDTMELRAAVHLIQNAVLANAAARAYPGEYRLLGGRFHRPVTDHGHLQPGDTVHLSPENRWTE